MIGAICQAMGVDAPRDPAPVVPPVPGAADGAEEIEEGIEEDFDD